MAASRMSRIPSHRLTFLLTIACAIAATLAQTVDTEFPEDVELITSARSGSEYVAFAGADDETVKKSPFDLKKEALNDKFHKFHSKTEAEWNAKKDIKKSDVFIKDPKDFRLLRLISEGLLNPQDALPVASNDAITSSQINNSSKDIRVNVQPEGMSGLVNDEISADSDEQIIMEKKKNTAKEKTIKTENDSRESPENIKINLDANAGVQTPSFAKQKGSIAVPAQKQISLSKGKENHKKSTTEASSNYEILSLKPSKEKPVDDEGVFDFVDSPLSDKHLVPAGTAQTSRINVKKGPNGQDYEYEYIYYYYEDDGEISTSSADKPPKVNEIPVSTGLPVQKSTTSVPRISSTTPKYSKPFSDEVLGNRIKSTDVLNEEFTVSQRDKFRYSVDNSGELSKPIPSVPSKSSLTNEVHYQSQFNSNRFPGRQVPTPVVSEKPQLLVVSEEPIPSSTRQPSRGRSHYNAVTASTEDSSAYVTQFSPIPSREPQSRTKSSGIRQPGLELVDSNSFRTHSTNIPTSYDKTYSTVQSFENQPRSKPFKQNSVDSVGITQNLPSSVSTTSDLYKKEQTVEYSTDSERITPTTPIKISSPTSSQVTETIADNTAPFSTLSDNSLTTVYGAGLTDKAAHDLYAIYQQTQNEESKNTAPIDDRTTITDFSENTYYPTSLPTTVVFSTTTTTTTTTPAPTTTTTTAAPIVSTPLAGRGRFKGSGANRNKLGHASTTEVPASASELSNSENTEKSRVRFQPSNRREPGHRASAYAKKSSTSTASPDHDISTVTIKDHESSKPSFVASTRTRYRGGSVRSESGSTTESQSTSSASVPKANFADRFSRRRPGLRTTTPSIPADEETQKQEISSSENSTSEQQSTTFRSIRNKLNPNSQARPLRPGPKINFSSRGKIVPSSTTTAGTTPIDADTSGSADIPVEQKQTVEENAEQELSVSETLPTTTQSTTTVSTPPPDALTKLKNRPKLRVTDKATHAKSQSQQSNDTALNKNRRQLVNNLLPRKKQPTTETPKEEKPEIASKPVTEELAEDSSPKSETEVSENLSISEVSSTTESKLSSLLASRRRNLSARKPGTLANKQTTNEES